MGLVLAGFAGCSSTPLATYDLTAVTVGAPSRPRPHAVQNTLRVQLPDTISLLDTQRMVIRTGSQLAYLKGAQWSAPLPQLLQTRLIETFDQSQRLKVLPPPGDGAQFSLETDIRRFEADVTHSTATVEIYVRLLGAGGQIIDVHDFTGTAFVPRDDAR